MFGACTHIAKPTSTLHKNERNGSKADAASHLKSVVHETVPINTQQQRQDEECIDNISGMRHAEKFVLPRDKSDEHITFLFSATARAHKKAEIDSRVECHPRELSYLRKKESAKSAPATGCLVMRYKP